MRDLRLTWWPVCDNNAVTDQRNPITQLQAQQNIGHRFSIVKEPPRINNPTTLTVLEYPEGVRQLSSITSCLAISIPDKILFCDRERSHRLEGRRRPNKHRDMAGAAVNLKARCGTEIFSDRPRATSRSRSDDPGNTWFGVMPLRMTCGGHNSDHALVVRYSFVCIQGWKLSLMEDVGNDCGVICHRCCERLSPAVAK